MQTSQFKDYFSTQASQYARYRPGYPDKLFQFLASQCRNHGVAIDCATGNGQAASGLLKYFKTVIGLEPSKAQLRDRLSGTGVKFACALAEHFPVRSSSADLITVAQAFHWFDAERFYAEAARILRTDGILAMWRYTLPLVSENVDRVMLYFYENIVGTYWPPERRIVERGYDPLPDIFEPLVAPGFTILQQWNVDDYIGYLHSWSATQRYYKDNATDPVDLIEEDLRVAWGKHRLTKEVNYPLFLTFGRLRQT